MAWSKYYGFARQPEAPTEADAREEFQRQFRQAFPGRRAVSKFGQEKWLQVKDRATALVQARHAEAMARYREDAARIQARHGADTAQWEAECQRVWDLQALAAELAQEAGL